VDVITDAAPLARSDLPTISAISLVWTPTCGLAEVGRVLGAASALRGVVSSCHREGLENTRGEIRASFSRGSRGRQPVLLSRDWTASNAV